MSTLEVDVGDIRPVSGAFAGGDAGGRFELMAMGIHWPELDEEDLGIAGMLRGRPGM